MLLAGLLATALAGPAFAQKPPAADAPGGQAGKPAPLPAQPAPPPRVPQGQSVAPQAGNKPPPAQPGPAPGGRQVSSGTGFVVAAQRVLTNHHVVNGCSQMRARSATGEELPARVLASDPRRDLALLEVQGNPGPVLRFRGGPDVRRGEQVVVYGFPLAGLLSSGPTLTSGEISALSGLRDNPLNFQISAPVQQGNSGGPLLDASGHVVGVIVSKLDAQRIAQVTGDIPQNVNFAVKGAEALAFLRENRVQPSLADSGGKVQTPAEVGEIAHPSTLFMRCLR